MNKFGVMISYAMILFVGSCRNSVEITGVVYDKNDGCPLYQAIITDCKSGKTVVSDKDGAFSISVEEGDSINISYVGMLSKTIVASCKDSIHWKIGLSEYGPIIEPALQHSHTTYDGVYLSVKNFNDLANSL